MSTAPQEELAKSFNQIISLQYGSSQRVFWLKAIFMLASVSLLIAGGILRANPNSNADPTGALSLIFLLVGGFLTFAWIVMLSGKLANGPKKPMDFTVEDVTSAFNNIKNNVKDQKFNKNFATPNDWLNRVLKGNSRNDRNELFDAIRKYRNAEANSLKAQSDLINSIDR